MPGYSDPRYTAYREWMAADAAADSLTSTGSLEVKRLNIPVRIMDFKAFVDTAIVGPTTSPVLTLQQVDEDGSSNAVAKAIIDDFADGDAQGTIRHGELADGSEYLYNDPQRPTIAAGKCMDVNVTTECTGGTPAGTCFWLVVYAEDPV